MQFAPYVFFYGRCEEALNFYKGVFNGTCQIQRVGEMPAEANMPAQDANRVMHARFTAPGIAFMASDGRDDKAIDPDAGNITLSVELDDGAEGDRIFGALADGGTVSRPMDAAFWGGRFGIAVDRFGIEWMVSAP